MRLRLGLIALLLIPATSALAQCPNGSCSARAVYRRPLPPRTIPAPVYRPAPPAYRPVPAPAPRVIVVPRPAFVPALPRCSSGVCR